MEGAKKGSYREKPKVSLNEDIHQILLMTYLVPGTLPGSGMWREIQCFGEGANDS